MYHIFCRGFFMSISLEKGRTKQILFSLLIWLLSAVVLALIADLLILRLKLNSRWIAAASSVILFLASAASSCSLFHGAKGNRWMPAALLGLVMASTLLMTGFLVNSESVDLAGLARVLAGSLLGAAVGAWIRRPYKKNSARFIQRKSKKL